MVYKRFHAASAITHRNYTHPARADIIGLCNACLLLWLEEAGGENKFRARTGDAFHPDFPAHFFDQTLADRKPQTGSAKFSGNAGISLGKRPEKPVYFLPRHAYSRVLHNETQHDLSAFLFLQFCTHCHLTLPGKLDRIARQVDQHLPQP